MTHKSTAALAATCGPLAAMFLHGCGDLFQKKDNGGRRQDGPPARNAEDLPYRLEAGSDVWLEVFNEVIDNALTHKEKSKADATTTKELSAVLHAAAKTKKNKQLAYAHELVTIAALQQEQLGFNSFGWLKVGETTPTDVSAVAFKSVENFTQEDKTKCQQVATQIAAQCGGEASVLGSDILEAETLNNNVCFKDSGGYFDFAALDIGGNECTWYGYKDQQQFSAPKKIEYNALFGQDSFWAMLDDEQNLAENAKKFADKISQSIEAKIGNKHACLVAGLTGVNREKLKQPLSGYNYKLKKFFYEVNKNKANLVDSYNAKWLPEQAEGFGEASCVKGFLSSTSDLKDKADTAVVFAQGSSSGQVSPVKVEDYKKLNFQIPLGSKKLLKTSKKGKLNVQDAENMTKQVADAITKSKPKDFKPFKSFIVGMSAAFYGAKACGLDGYKDKQKKTFWTVAEIKVKMTEKIKEFIGNQTGDDKQLEAARKNIANVATLLAYFGSVFDESAEIFFQRKFTTDKGSEQVANWTGGFAFDQYLSGMATLQWIQKLETFDEMPTQDDVAKCKDRATKLAEFFGKSAASSNSMSVDGGGPMQLIKKNIPLAKEAQDKSPILFEK